MLVFPLHYKENVHASVLLPYVSSLQGLIVRSRFKTLQHFKKPWAHEHEPVRDIVDAVKV